LTGELAGLKSRFYRTLLWRRYRSQLGPRLAGYDLYHWHCFLPEQLPLLDCTPPSTPILMSLWGSDLFRTSGLAEFKRQLAACRRTVLFTVASLEMRETFLAKFGREFAPNVRFATYGTSIVNFEETRAEKKVFLETLGVPEGHSVITIGNSGSEGNQHLGVLTEIGRLPADLLSRIAILLPMTYSATSRYIEQVISNRFGPARRPAAHRFSSSTLECPTEMWPGSVPQPMCSFMCRSPISSAAPCVSH
jgi:hypothetical protein